MVVAGGWRQFFLTSDPETCSQLPFCGASLTGYTLGHALQPPLTSPPPRPRCYVCSLET